MDNFLQNLHSPPAQAAGLALLHFLWQGALVAGALALTNRMMRRASANLRYTTACLALLACVLIPIGTFVLLGKKPDVARSGGANSANEGPPATIKPSIEPPPAGGVQPRTSPQPALRPERASSESWLKTVHLEPLLPWVVCGWLVGVALLSARLLGGWVFVQHLRSRLIRPAAREWHTALERLAAKLRVRRRIWLFESAAVDAAMVIGWLRPVVLLPAGLITGLTPGQIETLIAHELAHIRRHDYLVNLLQSVAETLLFYHPLVWWISQCIREERENCCDDLVLTSGGDELCYAEALARLAEARATELQFSLAASGGSLTQRIQRLVAGAAPVAGRPGRGVTGFLFLLLVGFLCVQASSVPTGWVRAGSNTRAFDSQKFRSAIAAITAQVFPNDLASREELKDPNLHPEYRRVLTRAIRRMDLWFDAAPLPTVMTRLSQLLGTELSVTNDISSDLVTVAFNSARLDEILTAILARKRLGWRWVKDGSGPAPIRIYTWSSRTNRFFSTLDPLSKEGFEAGWVSVSYRCTNLPLSFVLQQIGNRAGLRFVCPKTHSSLPVSCDTKDGFARDVLANLLPPLGLDYRVKTPSEIEVFPSTN